MFGAPKTDTDNNPEIEITPAEIEAVDAELEASVSDLAAILYARMEQLDASTDEPWEQLEDGEREFYRQGVKAILSIDRLPRAIELRRRLRGK